MCRNIIIFLVLIFLACSNKQERPHVSLSEKEKYEFINNIYRNELDKGCVYLYDEPITSQNAKDSIIELNNIVFKNDLEYISNSELWKEEYLDKRFFLIKTFDSYDSDLIFNNEIMIMISQPMIDISGKYILIVEEKLEMGFTIDINTYIYTKDNKNNWNIYYKLHTGKDFD